jgi:hypothetical protein
MNYGMTNCKGIGDGPYSSFYVTVWVVIVDTISNYLIIENNKKIGHGGDDGSGRP